MSAEAQFLGGGQHQRVAGTWEFDGRSAGGPLVTVEFEGGRW